MIAGFIFLRLRGILGKKTGFEEDLSANFDQKTEEKKYKNHPQRENIQLHFIGKLQSNKIKKAVNLFDVIQTTENIKQAAKINQEAQKLQKKQKIYIQINISKV